MAEPFDIACLTVVQCNNKLPFNHKIDNEGAIDLYQRALPAPCQLSAESEDRMKEFVIQALAASTIAEAYIFANLAIPGLEIRAWQQYASDIIKGKNAKTGILIIRRVARTHICGLVGYRTEIELLAGRVLHVTHLAAIDLLDQGPILSALLDRLAFLAQQSHCTSIRISLPEADRDRKHLYDALSNLRPRLIVKRRFGIEWDIHPPFETFDSI